MNFDRNGNISWGCFKELDNNEDLELYMKNRHESQNRRYCHYTNLKNIDNILKNKTFWLGNVKDFNDNKDKEQFSDKNHQFFYSLCFSSGENENLSLWYMYAGMDGKGGRIKISYPTFSDLIKHGIYALYEYDDNNRKLDKKVMELRQNETVNIFVRDMLYYKQKGSIVNLKYNTMTNYNMPTKDFEKYKKNNVGFVKGLIWYYEKETRVLAELIGDATQKIDLDKSYKIVLNIDDKTYKKLHIDLAPQISNIENEVDKYESIKKFMIDTSRIKLSDYEGTIDMKFCKSCSQNKEESTK